MPHKKRSTRVEEEPTASKDLEPFSDNFAPIFFQNQFRTRIPLPTKAQYQGVAGQCAIVTGCNSGLGFEASSQLLSLGLSHLVMGVRSLERGQEAARKLRLANASARIDVWHLDMESYESVQAFARKCQEELAIIDMVILNAGLSPWTFEKVAATGHERTVQVNHISTTLLAVLLVPTLKVKSRGKDALPPRLTVVSSLTAHLCKFPNRDKRPLLPSFDDVSITPWNAHERYGVSKLLCQLSIVKLSELVNRDDTIITLVEPGLIKGTKLSRDLTGIAALGAKLFFGIAGRNVQAGAATYVDAVLGHGKESHGCYLMNFNIAPLACWFYTDGEVLTDAIWEETMQELEPYGVERIVAQLAQG